MIEAPVSAASMYYIWARMWARGQEEIFRFGLDMRNSLPVYLGYAAKGRSGVLFDGDEPVIAAGIVNEELESWTWFVATDRFHDHAKEITKYMRKCTREHRGVLHIYSPCVHPDTERWFRLLGFVRDDDYKNTTSRGFPLYRFKR